MKILPPAYYKKVNIADNANDVYVDEQSLENEKTPDNFAVYVNEYGMIRKIVKHGKNFINDIIYEYSNKGNLIGFIFMNNRGLKIKEKYDYTQGEKALFSKHFFKGHKLIKKEKYSKNSNLIEIMYYMEDVIYCSEFFKENEKHPYKVEYYNKDGLKI